MERWFLVILGSAVLLALGVIALLPDSKVEDIFSGMVTKNLDYCTVSCADLSKFFYKQDDSPYNVRSYTINERDYFLVSLKDLSSRSITAIYRYDGLKLDNADLLANAEPYRDTGNYVKLSLIYARVSNSLTIEDNFIAYNFNCQGQEILVPIVNPGYVGKEISLGEESSVRGKYLANVQIKPFDHVGQGKFVYNSAGFQVPDYVKAAIFVAGHPIGFSKAFSSKTSLLVDLDGDGTFGGDVSDKYEGTKICSANVYRGNLPGLYSTSYRGAGSKYE